MVSRSFIRFPSSFNASLSSTPPLILLLFHHTPPTNLFHQSHVSAELAAAAWTLPDGTLLFPRLASHAADAPYLGEAAILCFLTVQPSPGAPLVPTKGIPGLGWIGLALFFGVPGALWRPWLRRGVYALSGRLSSVRYWAGSEPGSGAVR